MKKTLLSFLVLLLLLTLTACGGSENPEKTEPPVTVAPREEIFSAEDLDSTYSTKGAAVITLCDTTATAESDAVRIVENAVTILDEGTYILRGSLKGTLTVSADPADLVTLVLDGAELQKGGTPPLRITKAAKVKIIVVGEANSIKNTATGVSADNLNDAILSKAPLVLTGDGILRVHSSGGHGITVKDTLTVSGGRYTVNAKRHALDANEAICLTGCTMNLTAGMDGIHAENTTTPTLAPLYIADGSYTVNATGDAISTSDAMQIGGGSFTLKAGGGSTKASSLSAGGKGLKAATALTVAAGSFTIDAADDACHANLSVTIGDATLTLATGDDAIHADDSLHVAAGRISVSACYEGLEARHVRIDGGTLDIRATDDGINALGGQDAAAGDSFASGDGSITVTGGIVSIYAHGDAIDAKGSFTMTGGEVTLEVPMQGGSAILGYTSSATVTGGTVIGVGSSAAPRSFTSAAQGVIALSVGYSAEGSALSVHTPSGKTVLNYTPKEAYAYLLISSPALAAGEEYTVTVGEKTLTVTAE